MADGVLSLKGTLVGARGSGSGGHVIKDNGTAVTQRPTMNMTDFDIADDNTNEETDIKPHRITSAEMSEICSPLPDAPTLVGNVRMSLLWTNPSPRESFAAGDIALSDLTCDAYVLICHVSKGNTISVSAISSGLDGFYMQHVTNDALSRRTFVFASNKLSVANCQTASYGQSFTTNNDNLIPYKIYGIKLI